MAEVGALITEALQQTYDKMAKKDSEQRAVKNQMRGLDTKVKQMEGSVLRLLALKGSIDQLFKTTKNLESDFSLLKTEQKHYEEQLEFKLQEQTNRGDYVLQQIEAKEFKMACLTKNIENFETKLSEQRIELRKLVIDSRTDLLQKTSEQAVQFHELQAYNESL